MNDDDDDQNWNPRYVYYANAHGRSPKRQFEIDRKAYSGCMIGFMNWMSEKKAEFYKAHPEAFFDKNVIGDIEAWDNFLRKSTE
jgi:hypothetical protein